ncbi:MAG: cupredoxin domain-containing protein [Aquihabitans sp.]
MNKRESKSRVNFGAALLAAALIGVVLSSCGSEEASTDDCTVVAPSSPGVTEVTISAKDMSFSESCVEVQPGTLTIEFVNEDTSVAHNLRVKGNGIDEATALESGPFTEDLTVELDTPGDYPFKCDPHPNMKGVIVVAKADAGAPTVPSN